MTSMAEFQASAAAIRERYSHPVQVVSILGSGLGSLAETILSDAVRIPYADIPGFPQSNVAGHGGNLFLGKLPSGMHMACFQGRVHFYEGHSMDTLVYPLRVLRLLGTKTLIVTNAAGGVNPTFKAGSLMLIDDHINLLGTNPLIGPNLDAFGPRFSDMSHAYTPALKSLALEKAKKLGLHLERGVYCAMTGPSYETPAEIRMLRAMGGDAVGMSTVPEVIVAAHMGMWVLGISCITNPAAGVLPEHTLNHQEVLEAAAMVKEHFSALIQAILQEPTLVAGASAQAG